MSSETPHKLPIIDFSVQPQTLKWNLVRDQVRRAAEEFGCFEARFDRVSLDIRRAAFEAMGEVFELPLATKLQNVSEKPYHGYIGQSTFAPLYESMGFEQANIHEKVETLTNIFWPQGNPKFSKTIQTFSKQLSELDQIVRRMILESFGVDQKKLEQHIASTNYLFRVMKYDKPRAIEAKAGLNAHTDLNFSTILYQHQVDGLEIQTKEGEWIPIKPSPGSFIVIIGDSLKAYSNGRLHSPYHRVMMRGDAARYSSGLFCTPKEGSIVRAPEELVDEEHPLMYRPYHYNDFLHFYTTEAGQRAESALNTFCAL